MGHGLGMKSRVYPKYMTKHRVGNWAEYDRPLAPRAAVALLLSLGLVGMAAKRRR
jgi:hypothetical protein